MGRYRKVDTRIWNDERFCKLSDDGKLAFLFILTHPHMTSLGAMRATVAGLASEIGWTAERLRKAFGKGSRNPSERVLEGMIEIDEKACFVGLPNFLKYNPPENPNVIRSWSHSWELLPECELKTRLYERTKSLSKGYAEGFRKAFAEIEEAFAKSMPNPEQEQEPKQEQEQEQEQEEEEERAPDNELIDWCLWWNELHDRKLVASGVRPASPSEGIRAGWVRFKRHRELRDLLADRSSVEVAIEKSPICRDGWFRLEKLFGGKNKSGEYIAKALLDGAYFDSNEKRKASANGSDPPRAKPASAAEKADWRP